MAFLMSSVVAVWADNGLVTVCHSEKVNITKQVAAIDCLHQENSNSLNGLRCLKNNLRTLLRCFEMVKMAKNYLS
jgi:hypothetical protein